MGRPLLPPPSLLSQLVSAAASDTHEASVTSLFSDRPGYSELFPSVTDLLPTCHQPSCSKLVLHKLLLLQTLGWKANFWGEAQEVLQEGKAKKTQRFNLSCT